MPTECPDPCGDFTFPEWQALNPKAQLYYLYCALSDAAAQGFPELIGVYTVTEDADYVAPADASLIIWNVPTQSEARFITFQGNPGQETQVLVLNSNGEFVGDAYSTAGVFALLDTAPYVVNVRVVDSTTGEIVRSDGTAAQYDVGSDSINIPTVATADSRYINTVGNETKIGQFTVQNPAAGNLGITVQTTENSGIALLRWTTPSRTWQFGAGGSTSFFANQWYIYDEGAGAARITLNTAGDFAIGTNPSSSAAKLDVQGTFKAGISGTVMTSLANGVATLAAGTVSVTDASVTAGSIIQLTPGFAPAGMLYYTISAGVGFTIQSTNAGDAGSVSWTRIVP